MKLIIVDDHEVVRGGLIAMLGSEEGLEIVGSAATAADAIRLATEAAPDAAVVDLRLPDMSGEELTRRLLRERPGMTVIVLSTYLSEDAVRGALAAGATAYVTKAAGVQRLRDLLRAVRDGKAPTATAETAGSITRELNELVDAREGALRATPQQSRVLELAAQGLTNKEVGAKLFISESTVRFHIQKLKETTGSRTRTELIAKAIRTGMIEPHYDAPPNP